MFRPLYVTNMEGRSLLSRGSVDRQTAQSQPIVGTPELVPEPSTVIFRPIICSEIAPSPARNGIAVRSANYRACAAPRSKDYLLSFPEERRAYRCDASPGRNRARCFPCPLA